MVHRRAGEAERGAHRHLTLDRTLALEEVSAPAGGLRPRRRGVTHTGIRDSWFTAEPPDAAIDQVVTSLPHPGFDAPIFRTDATRSGGATGDEPQG